jgi:hypothetical protein
MRFLNCVLSVWDFSEGGKSTTKARRLSPVAGAAAACREAGRIGCRLLLCRMMLLGSRILEQG